MLKLVKNSTVDIKEQEALHLNIARSVDFLASGVSQLEECIHMNPGVFTQHAIRMAIVAKRIERMAYIAYCAKGTATQSKEE